jgi:Ca2+-binding RTX toxin-like protein
VSRKDQVFGCEIVRRVNIRGRIPDGTVVTATTAGDDDWTGCCANTTRHLAAGLAGDDELDGHAGSDVLWGNEGNDTLIGGSGRDWLLGGLGDDVLQGQDGNDRIWGGWGLDVLDGGIGDDELISIDMDPSADEIWCGLGNDRVVKRAIDRIMDPGHCERVIVVRLR